MIDLILFASRTCNFVKYALPLQSHTLLFYIMANKLFLLPHCWQIVGAVIVLIGIAGFSITAYEEFFRFFGYWFIYFGVLIVALSREKVEDEFVNFIRLRTIYRIVLIYVLYTFIANLCQYLISYYLPLEGHGRTLILLTELDEMPLWISIYFVVFKRSLYPAKRYEK